MVSPFRFDLFVCLPSFYPFRSYFPSIPPSFMHVSFPPLPPPVSFFLLILISALFYSSLDLSIIFAFHPPLLPSCSSVFSSFCFLCFPFLAHSLVHLALFFVFFTSLHTSASHPTLVRSLTSFPLVHPFLLLLSLLHSRWLYHFISLSLLLSFILVVLFLACLFCGTPLSFPLTNLSVLCASVLSFLQQRSLTF